MSINLPLKKINVELEFPVEWLTKIEEIAQEKKQTLAEVIVNLIGENLDLDTEKLNYLNLQKKYLELNKRLALLETKDYEIEKLDHRLDIMEKLMSQLQRQKFSSRPQLLNLPASNDDDDFEDEPDEVLTDFLLD